MRLEFTSDAGHAGKGALGLIVLETDETLEPELRDVVRDAGQSLYHSRIRFRSPVTPETLAMMAKDIPHSASLLSGDIPFSVIGYGCTSASTLIGSDQVAALIQQHHPDVKVSDPIAAVIAAGKSLNAKRIGFLTPYRADVSAAMRAKLEGAGFEIAAFASFDEEDDHKVALISEASVLSGMTHVGAQNCDLVFSACTNLRSFGVLAQAEETLGIPVISSNSALAWHMLRLSGEKGSLSGPSILFQKNLIQ